MRYARELLAYNQNRWLDLAIQNSIDHMDKIYVIYSDVPWTKYNKNARKQFKNNTNMGVLDKYMNEDGEKYEEKNKDKIIIIKGEWHSDEEQRNACIQNAKDDNIDILIAQDTDEFLFNDDYNVIKGEIEANPNYEEYRINWMLFWKTWEYAIQYKDDKIISGPTPFCMNIKYNPDLIFQSCRGINGKNHIILSPTLYHGAYILDDNEMYEKINTWGHSKQVVKGWYENKWLKWTPETLDLHNCWPKEWKRAIKYTGVLPETIQ
jgi:hypothetical protein